MLLIHKAILRELTITFVLSVIFINISLMLENMLRLTRLISGVGAEIADMVQIVIYIQPQLLIMSIPMSLLISSLLTYSRMQHDNEIIILRSSGLSLKGIIAPAFFLGLVGFAIALSMSFYLAPFGSGLLNKKLFEILTQRAAMAIEAGVFNTAFKNIVILVKHKPSAHQLQDIFILDDKFPNEQKIIVAKKGLINITPNGISFKLIDGTLTLTGQNTITQLSFASYIFTLNVSLQDAVKQSNEMTPLELYKNAKLNPDKRLQLYIDLHRRFSLPAMSLLVAVIGPLITLFFKGYGRISGLSLGLAIFAIYYTLLLYGESLVKSAKLPHYVGSWMAFAVLLIATILLLKKVAKE